MSDTGTTEVRKQVDDVIAQDGSKGLTIDVKERDPNKLNDIVMVHFDEIIGEPHADVFAFDYVWVVSYKAFVYSKLWCYRITTLIFAVPIAILCGVHYALLACFTIWCCRPCLKFLQIVLSYVRELTSAFQDAICTPCWVSFSYMFYNIRVNVIKGEA